jgi:hypothetical protein
LSHPIIFIHLPNSEAAFAADWLRVKAASHRRDLVDLGSVLLTVSLPQSKAWATAVFVDEFDAGRFESPSDGVERQPPRFVSSGLKLAHRHDTDKRCFRQIRLAPAQYAPRSSALFSRNHPPTIG